jgi:hypothetical protein
MSDEKTLDLRVSLTKKEREMMQAYCDQQGTKLAQWGRDVLMRAVPLEVRKHFLGDKALTAEPQEATVLTDSAARGVAFPRPAPTAPSEEPTGPLEDLNQAPTIPDHSCVHVRLYFRPPSTPKDCIGTCMAPRSMGKSCHWPAGTAKNCTEFRPRFHPRMRP